MLLLGIGLPSGNGLEVARVRQLAPAAKILFLTESLPLTVEPATEARRKIPSTAVRRCFLAQ